MLSYSASSAVISPWISGCGLVLESLATETLTLPPIFAPDLAITIRSESRNRSTKVSGSRKLSSTWAETSSALASSGMGEPLISTTKAELVGAMAQFPCPVSSAALGSISTLPSRIRSGSSTRLK